MWKILISDKLSEIGINFLNEQPDIQVHIQTNVTEDQLCEIIGEYDALLIRSGTKVTSKVIQSADRLKVIGRAGIGVDNIDCAAATERGIIVMNTPDSNATTTAELAVAHMMSLSRHLPTADASVRQGKWERSKLMGSELAHKTLAILGFGTIGRIVADRARGLKMNVIAYDPFVTDKVFEELLIKPVDLDDLFKEADYLTLHCPSNERTRNIVDAEKLALMKNEARIINCARGGLINEQALYKALSENSIAGAALDVFEQEPPADSPLLTLPNVVFTPHLGASTEEAQEAVSVEIARQAVTYFRTGEAINALNLPRLSADALKKLKPFLLLSNKLGQVLGQLAPNAIDRLEVKVLGRVAELEIHPISVEVLVGLLNGELSIPVNRVNVNDLAKRQGISVTESKSEEPLNYLSLISVVGHSGDQSVQVEGTLLGDCHPRLTGIDDFEVEIVPEGNLLITHHKDQPGVIASLGTVLGTGQINISRMQVALCEKDSEQAIAVMTISSPLDADLMDEIRNIPAVNNAEQITL